ncbi:hypothetical protein HIM_09337 [Hirsutella minnesotensis 3608]|uniref:O-methyltransferase n=1 Tax=Hirsutella minnesotensis 3608 TaxID=1043627 RepID=A0A0F8A360_9HYPO|nr:hypothetical protein HIM_09337 [Hirsutella minnesotensis 3608]
MSAQVAPTSNILAGVPEHIRELLDRLHAESEEQEAEVRPEDYKPDVIADKMRDKFIALDQDKAQYVYALCRAIGARDIVEAGTSFGVSTIYLALAASANAQAARDGRPARVIATEHEPSKADRARANWRQCGDGVANVIELREGDLLQTLQTDLPNVDFLLLDIWAPMALPTLKLVEPKMRPGAVVVLDNTIIAAEGYKDLLAYLHRPGSHFINTTLPYKNGLGMSIYTGASM